MEKKSVFCKACFFTKQELITCTNLHVQHFAMRLTNIKAKNRARTRARTPVRTFLFFSVGKKTYMTK